MQYNFSNTLQLCKTSLYVFPHCTTGQLWISIKQHWMPGSLSHCHSPKKSCLYCWFPWQSFPIWSRDLEGGLLPVGECGNLQRRSTQYAVSHRYRTQSKTRRQAALHNMNLITVCEVCGVHNLLLSILPSLLLSHEDVLKKKPIWKCFFFNNWLFSVIIL